MYPTSIIKLLLRILQLLHDIERELSNPVLGAMSVQDRKELNSLRRGIIRALYKLPFPH